MPGMIVAGGTGRQRGGAGSSGGKWLGTASQKARKEEQAAGTPFPLAWAIGSSPKNLSQEPTTRLELARRQGVGRRDRRPDMKSRLTVPPQASTYATALHSLNSVSSTALPSCPV
jgi:hypothetical protein